ncbi:hypothetical protein ABW20_dc0106483 [Dactylellina cionopaga]|nr:hypothetical protein ABW20_dc0106483 [Dactylellina cionopaga]
MVYLPEEIKDEIIFYLSDQDLKALRVAYADFRDTASRHLFGKRNSLRLGGGRDVERGFIGGPSIKYIFKDCSKLKPVEFCRLETHLPSILPIAKYVTTLEYAPVVWHDDLLSVRIGTHSGEEDGFCYSLPYNAEDWRDERCFSIRQRQKERQKIGNLDVWADKEYFIPDRYYKDESWIEAAGFLAKRKYRLASTTGVRQLERGVWHNYQKLLPILHNAKKRLLELEIIYAPAYPFIGTNMPSALLESNIYVMNNLQRLNISFRRLPKLPNRLEADPVPGGLYKVLEACQGTLKALRIEFNDYLGKPDQGLTDLSFVFGGDTVKPILFSQLEELWIHGFVAPAADLERLIKSHGTLRSLGLLRVFINARSYDWNMLLTDIINPSKIDRLYLSQVNSGLGNTEKADLPQYDFSDGRFGRMNKTAPEGWKYVPQRKIGDSGSGPPWVRDGFKYDFFAPKQYPLFEWPLN